jgi:predicted ATP-dependent protease
VRFKNGQFNVYAVTTVDEALELLSDMAAGITDEQGNYPADSFNGQIENQLLQFSSLRKKFSDHSE